MPSATTLPRITKHRLPPVTRLPATAVRRPTSPPLVFAPRLKLTRCTFGSAIALGQESIGDLGQISANLSCSGRLGTRLTFSGGLTGFPISGKHGGDLTYSYALNWRVTDKVTLTYANYTAALTAGRALAGLGEGRLQLSRRLPRIPIWNMGLPSRALNCSASISVSTSSSANASLNCGVSVTKRLMVRFTALAYPRGAQTESSADFYYSASYTFGPRVTLSYSNYSNNRWPWNRSPSDVDLFHGGSVSLSYNWSF